MCAKLSIPAGCIHIVGTFEEEGHVACHFANCQLAREFFFFFLLITCKRVGNCTCYTFDPRLKCLNYLMA